MNTGTAAYAPSASKAAVENQVVDQLRSRGRRRVAVSSSSTAANCACDSGGSSDGALRRHAACGASLWRCVHCWIARPSQPQMHLVHLHTQWGVVMLLASSSSVASCPAIGRHAASTSEVVPSN